jgi:NAD(P)-dependent dehydrogenase (short-subunit alcohol dehydrogenase family)
LIPGGVENVLNHAKAETTSFKPTMWDEFSLKDRVGIVSGGNRGLGLEMSLALCELGARIYALDLPKSPSEDFEVVAKHVAALGENRSLEYVSADVTIQKDLLHKVEESEPCFP